MDSLIATLITTALAETGDRTQLLAAALALRFHNDKMVILALALATLLNCILSAVLGSMINQWISEDPVRLFNGLAYVLAGVGMLVWRRPVDLLENWKLGVFLTAFLGIFILQFGDKSQFIIGANAAAASHWSFAAMGGFVGTMLAIVPAIILKERLAVLLPLKLIRRAGGFALLLLGMIHMLRAWRIL
jgi:Ca2+/H+ antiporter, TMEM165/GDT1 family